MAQHDQVIDNGSGLTVRTDINAALAAVFSSSSGPVEPGTIVAGQLWFDTSISTAAKLWVRNITNTGWNLIADFSQLSVDLSNGKRPTPESFYWNDKLDGSGPDLMTLMGTTGNLSLLGKLTASDLVAPTINGKPIAKVAARSRNRVNNPTAQISQENGSTAVTASGAYPADQWQLSVSGIVSAAAKTTPATLSPEGTNSAVTFNASTAKPSLAAGDYLQLVLPIEGYDVVDLAWGTAAAKPVVLRFNALVGQTGTFGFSLNNNTNDRCYCGSFTITTASVWQTFSFAIPGDTTGTWAPGGNPGIKIHFVQAVGSTLVGIAGWQAGNFLTPPGCTNGAAITTANFIITDVGLYKDIDNTGLPPPFEAPSYEDDLARCQRYWRSQGVSVSGYGAASGDMQVSHPLSPLMRVVPSVSVIGAGSTTNIAAANTFPSIDRLNVQIQPTTVGNMGLFNRNYGLNARLI